jgi:nicotinamidase-related amidase
MNRKLPALVVIDVQKGFENPAWGERNNPAAEANIESLLEGWRAAEAPVVLVRHDSVVPGSVLAPGQPGNDFKPGIDGPHDLLVTKSVNSAFYGTPNLEEWLRNNDISGVVVCGLITNHCCETTARMAGNLGFETHFVLDATATFPREAKFGSATADELWRATAISIDGEFATVVDTPAAIRLLEEN